MPHFKIMKTIYLALTLLSSCTIVTTQNAAGGKSTFATVGGDAKQVEIGPNGAKIGETLNSNAVNKTVNAAAGLGAAALVAP